MSGLTAGAWSPNTGSLFFLAFSLLFRFSEGAGDRRMNPADANSPPRKISPTRSSDSSLFPEVVPPELAVLQENLAFDAVFQSSSEPLLVVDSQGRIENANAPARALLRLPRNPPAGAAYLGHCLAAAAADSAGQFWKQCAQLGESPKTLDASLRSGFPIRIALRAVLPASGQLLLCLGEASPRNGRTPRPNNSKRSFAACSNR